MEALEAKIGKRIPLLSKILLSDTGILEDKLHIILNSIPIVHVIKQIESDQVISRQIYMIDPNSNRRLVYAHSHICSNYLPLRIIDQIRDKKLGLGRIMLEYHMEIHKEILTLGYDPRNDKLFRSYRIYNKKRPIIKVKEVILVTDYELSGAIILK
jgi:chorismate-pyruvate lyase